MRLAEAKPSAAPPSCPTPLRGRPPRDGFAVFYTQNVVRLREHRGTISKQFARGSLPRGGEGDALL